MPGNRLFRPSENLDVRDPLSNSKENGNIVNPPRYAEFGGLSSGSKTGIHKNDKRIVLPGQSGVIRKVPQSNK